MQLVFCTTSSHFLDRGTTSDNTDPSKDRTSPRTDTSRRSDLSETSRVLRPALHPRVNLLRWDRNHNLPWSTHSPLTKNPLFVNADTVPWRLLRTSSTDLNVSGIKNMVQTSLYPYVHLRRFSYVEIPMVVVYGERSENQWRLIIVTGPLLVTYPPTDPLCTVAYPYWRKWTPHKSESQKKSLSWF